MLSLPALFLSLYPRNLDDDAFYQSTNSENNLPRAAEPDDGAAHRADRHDLPGPCGRGRVGCVGHCGHLLPDDLHGGVRVQHRCASAYRAPQRRRQSRRNRADLHAGNVVSAGHGRSLFRGVAGLGAVAAGTSDRVAGDLRRRRVVSRLPYVRVLLLVRRGDVPCLLRRDDQYPYPDGQLGGHGPDERGAELPADFRRVGDSAARNRRRGHRFGHFGGRVARLFRRLYLSSCRVADLRPVPVQGNRVEDSPAGVRGFGLDHVAGGDRLYQLVHLFRGDRKPGRAAARRYEYGA